MSKIPQGAELSGKNKVFSLARTLELAFGEHKEDFGVIVDHPFTDEGGKVYQYTGWLGGEYGKTEPIVVEFNAEPGTSEGGNAKPTMKIFVQADGALVEVATLWSKVGPANKPFHVGKLGKASLFAFAFEKKAAADQPQG